MPVHSLTVSVLLLQELMVLVVLDVPFCLSDSPKQHDPPPTVDKAFYIHNKAHKLP